MFYMNKSKIKCMIYENIHYLIKAVNTSFVAVVVLDDMWLPVLHGTDSLVFVQRVHQDDISTQFLGTYDTKPCVSVKANFDERASLPLVPTVVSFGFSSS